MNQSEPSAEVIEKAQAASRGSGFFGRWRRHAGELLPAHAIYAVSLESLLEPSTISEIAEPIGWQFLLRRRNEPIAIEVGDRGLDVQIERGPHVSGASRFFEETNAKDRDQEDVPPARILRMPEMGITAVWLQQPGLGEGKIVPLDPAPEEFQPLTEYGATEFLAQAAGAAQRLLELSSIQGPYPEEEGG